MTITHGLPVTTIERTVTDLVEARTDLSLWSQRWCVKPCANPPSRHQQAERAARPTRRPQRPAQGDGAALLDETPKIRVGMSSGA